MPTSPNNGPPTPPDPLSADLARHAADLEQCLARARHDLLDFAHIAAHDLKEPFRTINFQASFILDDHRAALPEDAIKKIEGIQKAAVRGSRLVDEMMRYARSGDLKLAHSPVELASLVYEAASSLPAYKPQNGEPPEVELIIGRNLPTLTVDPLAMSQVFQNLLANAARYNRSATKKVRVSVREQGTGNGEQQHPLSSVQICIADNGIGIPPAQRPTALRIFKRLHREDEFAGSGSGVGLAIVKKVVEAHGGEVAIEDNPEGQGTVFVLTLPRR